MEVAQEKMYTYPKSVWMYKWGLIPFNLMILTAIVVVSLMDAGGFLRNKIILLLIMIGFLIFFDHNAISHWKIPRYIWVNEEGIRGKPLFGRDIFFRWDEINTIIQYRLRACIELVRKSGNNTFVINKDLIGYDELFDIIKSHTVNAEIITKAGW